MITTIIDIDRHDFKRFTYHQFCLRLRHTDDSINPSYYETGIFQVNMVIMMAVDGYDPCFILTMQENLVFHKHGFQLPAPYGVIRPQLVNGIFTNNFNTQTSPYLRPIYPRRFYGDAVSQWKYPLVKLCLVPSGVRNFHLLHSPGVSRRGKAKLFAWSPHWESCCARLNTGPRSAATYGSPKVTQTSRFNNTTCNGYVCCSWRLGKVLRSDMNM